MRNFPIPYDNELIYSVIARAGVHHGITSPKQLSEEVFSDRNVIATLDLPTHVDQLYRHLKDTQQITERDLIYKHTLFPLYAPFIPEVTRQKALCLMTGQATGAIHLLLGATASRVKMDARLRYCRKCLNKQLDCYGEHYWQRNWFLPGINICPHHGDAYFVKENNIHHRNQYIPLSSSLPVEDEVRLPDQQTLDVFRYLKQLLYVSEGISPDPQSWTRFYHEMADDIGSVKGRKILHADIKMQMLTTYGERLINDLNLSLPSNVQDT